MKKNLISSKKGQSEVISTVLLILVTIVAVMVIIAFVVPFVRNNLSRTECVKYVDKVSIVNNLDYSCYNTSTTEMDVQIHVGDVGTMLSGFSIEIASSSSKTFKIQNSSLSEPTGVKMYDGLTTLELPGKNEERTYRITGVTRPTIVRVYPILSNGQTCESASSLNMIEECP